MPLVSVTWRPPACAVAAGMLTASLLASPGYAKEPSSDESAEAETTSDDDKTTEELEVTTTAEAVSPTTDPRHPSGWVTRIEPDASFARGRDLADELESVEGLTVRRRSSLGQPAFASVRGGSPRQLSVHLNGIRIGAPAGVGFDFGSVSTGWLDSVDVHRGAAGASRGSGALTGSLDLRARPPASPEWESSATLLGGSFGTVGVATDASGGSESVRGDVSANWRRSRGNFEFVDAQGEHHRRRNNAHEQVSVGGTVGTEVGGGTLTGALLHHRRRRGAPGPSEFQHAYDRATITGRRTLGTIGWKKPAVAAPEWGVLDVKLGMGGMHRPLHYENPSAFLSGDLFETHSWKTTLSATGRASAYLDAGHIAHLALEVRSEHFRTVGGTADFSSLRADRQVVGISASDEWLLFDDALSVIGGVRTEFVHGRTSTAVPVIPSAGVIWRALEWLRFRANAARTHRTPDFDELYLRTELVRGNPDLDPERAWNVDAGFELGARSSPVRGKVTLFRNDFRDMILFLPQTAYLFRAENLGDATSRGVEAAGTLRLAERYRLRTSYTFTDAHVDATPSVQLPHHPRHRGSISNRLELGRWGPLSGLRSLELRLDGRARSALNLDNFGNLRNPPYWQVDVGTTLQPTPSISIGLELQNITNNRRGADYLQRPLPGRAFYASLQYTGEGSN